MAPAESLLNRFGYITPAPRPGVKPRPMVVVEGIVIAGTGAETNDTARRMAPARAGLFEAVVMEALADHGGRGAVNAEG